MFVLELTAAVIQGCTCGVQPGLIHPHLSAVSSCYRLIKWHNDTVMKRTDKQQREGGVVARKGGTNGSEEERRRKQQESAALRERQQASAAPPICPLIYGD